MRVKRAMLEHANREQAEELAALRARLAEAEKRIAAWEYASEVCDKQYRHAIRRLAEAEALLRDCYSPVRRIANGGSRTREDLDKAEATLARLDAFLAPDSASDDVIDGLRGIAPNATGEQLSEDFIRDRRAEWDAPADQPGASE